MVTCFGVLYHEGIKSDLKAIKELSRVCKPNGYVVITTPAGKFLASKLFLSGHDKSQHTGRRHNKNELKRLLKLSGLKPKKTTHMNMFLMPL